MIDLRNPGVVLFVLLGAVSLVDAEQSLSDRMSQYRYDMVLTVNGKMLFQHGDNSKARQLAVSCQRTLLEADFRLIHQGQPGLRFNWTLTPDQSWS